MNAPKYWWTQRGMAFSQPVQISGTNTQRESNAFYLVSDVDKRVASLRRTMNNKLETLEVELEVAQSDTKGINIAFLVIGLLIGGLVGWWL